MGGHARKKSKASISGAIVDTGLIGEPYDNSQESKLNVSAMSFYERQLKQKELID